VLAVDDGAGQEHMDVAIPKGAPKPSKEKIVTIKSTDPEHPHNWPKVDCADLDRVLPD
jgi:hypothetical protein